MRVATPNSLRRSAFWILGVVLVVTLAALAIEAAIITGCDGQGRRHTFILNDDTGEVTGHIYTGANHESCQ